jgi:hypothetical protein
VRPTGGESTHLQPLVLPRWVGVRGEGPSCQDPHGLGAFRPAETEGAGGALSTATTEEEASTASRDLRATPFHVYTRTREAPRTQRRWTALSRTPVTTTEDRRSGCRVTQEFTHHRSTLFHQTPAQRHPNAPCDESRVLAVDLEMS